MFSKAHNSIDPFVIKEDNPAIRDKKLDTTYANRFVAETSSTLGGKSLLGPVLNPFKVNLFWMVIFGVLVLFVGRLTYLQIWQGELFMAAAEGNRTRTIPIKAKRGIIYDLTGQILTRNVPTFSLEIITSELQSRNFDELLDTVLNHVKTNVTREELLEKLQTQNEYYSQPVELLTHISYQDALRLKVALNGIPGTDVVLRGNRQYLYGQSISHILGYLGKISEQEIELVRQGKYQFNDYLGKSGLELEYESILKGVDGFREIEVNALGQEQEVLSEKEPLQGKSLRLNIDIQLQEKIYQELQVGVEKSHSKKAAAIALDPQTGAIRAAVSLPSFDNNDFAQNNSEVLSQLFIDENQPLFFRVLQGEYPSGSTFKPLIATAALQEGIINNATSFLSNGGLAISSWFFPDRKAGGHGLTNVTKAIAESVNTFFYIIGGGYQDFVGLGVDKITDYARKFNLTRSSQIDYPSERLGFLPSKSWKEEYKQERWYIGDTYNLSIGQGDILVTPLQMAVAYSAILNGGKVMQPQIVDGYINETNGDYSDIPPKVISTLPVAGEHLTTVKKGLGDSVVYGSSRYLSLLSVSTGGKTGTAQVGGDKNPHAWFISFAPYENPELVLVVLIENGGEGSTYAVPVAYNVYKWYFEEYKK